MARRTYSIREVAALTGLAASTLRYYESIGIIPRVGRGDTSGHRVYSESDLDLVSWVSCLAATGMPIEQMRQYVANGAQGAVRARDQIDLLQTQDRLLAAEQQRLEIRRRYIRIKIDYWTAVDQGNQQRAEQLADQAARLGERIHHDDTHHQNHPPRG